MATINEDTVKGTAKDYGGKIEAFAGNIVGDSKTEAQGKIDELKGKAQDVYGQATEAFGKAKDTVKDWADKAPEQVRQVRETASRYADEAQAKVKTTVQEQPIAVLAGGIALGFVFGWLLSGRRD